MDLVIRNATIAGVYGVKDIGIRDGRIVEISDRIELRGVEEVQAMGFLVAPGFMDVHQHMDKALILERHDWSRHPRDIPARQANIAASNELKRHFTVEDVRERVIRTAEMCIVNGTTTVRTPRVGSRVSSSVTWQTGSIMRAWDSRGILHVCMSTARKPEFAFL